MAVFKYYLEKRKNKDGEFPEKNIAIIYSFSFDGYRIKSNFGERVDLKHWDTDKQRFSGGKDRTAKNDSLKAFQSKIEKIYRDGKILDQIVTPDYIRTKLKNEKVQNKSITDFFKDFIETKEVTIARVSLKSYGTTKNHLEKYINRKREKITLDKIDEKFFNGFVAYLIEKELTNNSINKATKNLKAFLNWAFEQKYHTNDRYRKFSFKETETEIFVLDWKELIDLYELAIKKKYLRQVRDVFCFGCFTGLRYSDIFNLKKDHITNGVIEVRTQKTKDLLKVPLNKYSKAILEKYKNIEGEKSLPVVSNQKMNDYLKELGEKAGLKTPVTRVRYRGTERIEETMPKYDILTTHIARKTFITNAFRLKIPVEIIMQISGHKDHKVFKKYNKIAQEQIKNEMDKFNSFEL